MAPRRSTRLHPQIHTSEHGAAMARSRHPQIHPSADGAGVTCRRSPRLHPQIHASEEIGAGMPRRIRRRRTGTSPEAADASLPDADDLLREILLRLPLQPSSLPRASAVCKRWRSIVTDPKFHRQFFAHHRKPPLLGFVHRSYQGIVLTSVLDPPDRIPPQRFDLRGCDLLDCRHGFVLQRRVAIPLELRNGVLEGAVLCAAAATDHSSPFKVVLMSMISTDYRPLTCVYSSETGLWGNLISAEARCQISPKPVVLVGNCPYWLSLFDGILEFDLDENSLTVIGVPGAVNNIEFLDRQIIEVNGVVGFAGLSFPRFQLWQRNVNAHGVTTWVPWKTIEMHSILGIHPQIAGKMAWMMGYDEDTDVIFLHATGNVYEVQLNLMKSRKLCEASYLTRYRPFKSFYTPGTTFAGEFNGPEMLHDA